MKIKEGYLLKSIAGEHVIVPIKKGAIKSVMTLNETGALLFERFAEGCDKEEAVTALLDAYDIDKDIAMRDVDGFINMLIDAGLFE